MKVSDRPDLRLVTVPSFGGALVPKHDPRNNETKDSEARRRVILETLRVGKSMSAAARAVGISRITLFQWRQDDPDFELACRDAIEEGTDFIEDEALRRAVEGVDEPMAYQGGVFATVKKFSDPLTNTLLAARRPEKYRQRVSAELSGPGGSPIPIQKVERQILDLPSRRLNDSNA